jgi:hypothetical protein
VRTRTGGGRDGELPGRRVGVGPGGHGDVLRGSRGEAAGIELGSSFVERITVNVGTALVLPGCRVANTGVGLGSSSADRVGAGRSRRSTPSRGKPVHMGKGGSGCEKERML